MIRHELQNRPSIAEEDSYGAVANGNICNSPIYGNNARNLIRSECGGDTFCFCHLDLSKRSLERWREIFMESIIFTGQIIHAVHVCQLYLSPFRKICRSFRMPL